RRYGDGIWGKLGIAGPISGMTYHLVSIGFLGVILILLGVFKLFRMLLIGAKHELDPYWKSFTYGGFLVTVVFIIDFITYSPSFVTSLYPLSFTYAYIIGTVIRRFSSVHGKQTTIKMNDKNAINN
ncbi:MAG: hypothetical protein ACOCUV_02375, partial [bacterium]